MKGFVKYTWVIEMKQISPWVDKTCNKVYRTDNAYYDYLSLLIAFNITRSSPVIYKLTTIGHLCIFRL